MDRNSIAAAITATDDNGTPEKFHYALQDKLFHLDPRPSRVPRIVQVSPGRRATASSPGGP